MERGELIAGRYELIKRLGRGGMGEVWAGRDRTLHREVALKLLVLEDASFPELPLRFEREAVAAAQINHPNAAALYDRGVHEDVLFLIMEKVEGATLTEHIRDESPMTTARALVIADGICVALVAAHRAGVIHYDIKPHNVMLTRGGQVKVVDFGIAGFIQTAFNLARSTQLTPAGTPEYGAPEQFLTERGDERSDLYALGGVLFAMLTGRPPFAGHSAMAVMRRKLDEEAPRLDSLRPDLPPALTALVAELLDRDPRRRPESARQVHERLSRLQTTPDARGEDTAEPREVLLAKAASAMKAVLANRAPLLRASLAKTVLQPPQSLAKTTVQTRRLPQFIGPFDVIWTGNESPSAYAARPGKAGIWLWTAGLSSIAAPSTYLGLHPEFFRVGPESTSTPWRGFLAIGLMSAFIALVCAIAAVIRVLREVEHTRLPKQRAAWTLHVGPRGLVTTGAAGRREFTWDRIQRVGIEEIQGSPSYRYTGVHLDPAPGGARPTLTRPAGWIYSQPDTVTFRESGRTPICVLGPMTKRQRAELIDALAGYGGQRWIPSVSFTSPPVDL
ncbi:protein kinase [Streptomyces canus]|uniref:serine/threonine-protein kinase n=1 Tax=Streptomyces canus TaxID=58343 RepID=UPI00370F92B8